MIFFGSRKYKFKWRTQLKEKQDLLTPNIGVLLEECTLRLQESQSGRIFLFSLSSTYGNIAKATEKALQQHQVTTAVLLPRLCVCESNFSLFLLPSLSLNWTSNLYHLCFPFRLTSKTWFPLDWKQVCWKLSALSSLYNVDCCLAPVWKQLFPSCTYWFWAVKDLSLDFLFLFALLFAASFIKKRLSLYTMPKNQLQLCYLTKLLPHFKARSPLGSFVSVNVPQRIRHSSVLFW